MRNFMPQYALCAVLGVFILLASFSLVRAQMAEQSVSANQKLATTDLSGLWMVYPSSSASSRFAFGKDDPPMTAWGETQYMSAKPVFGTNKTTPTLSNDPVYGCFPPGLPRIYLHPKPIEIVQLPDEVIMMYEYDRIVRHVYTDGRPHDEFLDPPLWMGDSIGKWDGDTLVIDVIGFNDKTWLDRIGHPHSDALHVVERMRRVDHNTLNNKITIEDPKAYTKSWAVQAKFQLKPDRALNWEGVCENKKLADRQ
jgi:hypothetical protein